MINDEGRSDAPADIGRIVSLIMENPKLIEEISNLANADKAQSEPKESLPEAASTDAPAVIMDSPRANGGRTQARGHLIGALKPYLSKERARAIDSMLSVFEIIDMMKTR